MKLTKILESILRELNIPKPEDAYKFDSIKSKDLGYGVYYTYIYTNVKGDKMEITVLLSNARNSTTPGPILYVAFGKYNPNKDQDEEESEESEEEEEKKYKEKTGANDMLKVMATAVEAIKQTAKKIGGMDNVYAISFSPSDKKRKNIYHHYIETLFPDFDKQTEKSYQFSFTKFVNKNFKGKEVNEIGLDSEKMKPYRFTTVEDGEDRRIYSFKTDSGLNYMVELDEEVDDEYGMVLYINFGTYNEGEENDDFGVPNQNVVTNKGEQYRVMNTLAAIIKEDLAINSYIKYITFNPAKRNKDVNSNAREKMYMKYIQGRLPNAKQIEDPSYPILIKIK
jgi:hypothetical protein